MKRVIVQNPATRLFLRDERKWTHSLAEAMDFSSSVGALSFCRKHKLANIQILLTFGSREYDVVLPVRESAPPLPFVLPRPPLSPLPAAA